MVHKVSPHVPMQQQHMIQQPKNNMGCEVTRQTRAVRTMISESYLLTGSTPVTPPKVRTFELYPGNFSKLIL